MPRLLSPTSAAMRPALVLAGCAALAHDAAAAPPLPQPPIEGGSGQQDESALAPDGDCYCGSGACAEARLGTICGVRELSSASEGVLPAQLTVEAFLGIRYATVPKRFAPSEEATAPWPLPYQATKLAPACIAKGGGGDRPYAGPTAHNASGQGMLYSEDCLMINIKRPLGVHAGDDLP